jgi:DNA primase
MAGLYSDDFKRRVRESNNIVDVVQAVVGRLVRAGRNLKACCPFHNEKTPSFNVNAEGQYFKCFGCGKSGDVFTFVMLYERVEFPDALKILAERAGIQVETNPQAAAEYKKESDWKSYLYKLNDVAKRFYREQLFSDAGKHARAYLTKRGINEEMAEHFELGYAPAGGSPLIGRLQSQKAPVKAIVRAGLASERDDGSARDFFYDRLMFPIHDVQGRVIAFGGRILGDGEPKYLNTRDTPLFSKTKTVYGVDIAKDAIIAQRKAILVEGYTDVMMCQQYGIANVVACLGTAITPDHIRQLRRLADEVLLLTDSDAAGARASERSIAVLMAEEMPARVVRLPGGAKDPCDFLLANGKELFLQALQQTDDIFDYKFEMVRKAHDLSQPLGLKAAAEDLLSLISLVPDNLLKNRYRYEVMRRLNIDERDLQYVPAARTESQSGAEDPMPELGVVAAPENKLVSAERELLRFLFQEPAWLAEAVTGVDLLTLTGKAESPIGRALFQALSEGVLPPVLNTLEEVDVGSIVAREVLGRLPSGNDEEGGHSAAHALCINLAEEKLAGTKLDAGLRLKILTGALSQEQLNVQYQTANLKLTQAKMAGQAEDERTYYEQVVTIRREISRLKSQSINQLTRQRGG